MNNSNDNWLMDMHLGLQGIPTGGAYNLMFYRPPKPTHPPLPPKKHNTATATINCTPSVADFKLPVYEPLKITAEEKAHLEKRERIRQKAVKEFEQELAAIKKERKAAWKRWWKMSLADKTARVGYLLNPAQVDLRINQEICKCVSKFEKRQLREDIPNALRLKYSLKKMQSIFEPVNRFAEKVIPTKSTLIFSEIIAMVVMIYATVQTGWIACGLLTAVVGFYSLNILKGMSIWGAILFFAIVYKLGELWEDFTIWLGDFLEGLFRVVKAILLFASCCLGVIGCIWAISHFI